MANTSKYFIYIYKEVICKSYIYIHLISQHPYGMDTMGKLRHRALKHTDSMPRIWNLNPGLCGFRELTLYYGISDSHAHLHIRISWEICDNFHS